MGAGELGDKASPEQLLAESAQLLRGMGVAAYVHPELAPLVRAVGLTHEAIIASIAETESRLLKLERAAQALLR